MNKPFWELLLLMVNRVNAIWQKVCFSNKKHFESDFFPFCIYVHLLEIGITTDCALREAVKQVRNICRVLTFSTKY